MNCLRCGKTASEGSSFCVDCLQTVSVPLQPSVYLNTQINLKAKRLARPARPALILEKPEPQTAPHKGLIFTVALLSVLCLGFAAACAFLTRDVWLPYLR